MVALSGGQLYLWDESSQSFKASAATQKLDHVAVGEGEIWGLYNSEVYQFDPESGQFVNIAGSGSFLAVAKEDDSVWLIGNNLKNLWQWDADGQNWTVRATYTGSANLIWLTARDENTVWALADDGSVLQWNPKSGTLLDQSAIDRGAQLDLRRREQDSLRSEPGGTHLLRCHDHRNGPSRGGADLPAGQRDRAGRRPAHDLQPQAGDLPQLRPRRR